MTYNNVCHRLNGLVTLYNNHYRKLGPVLCDGGFLHFQSKISEVLTYLI